MIEQTPLVVIDWHYHPPANPLQDLEKMTELTSLAVMKKRAATKKGIACRFSSKFTVESETILEYMTEDTYVIDLEDVIDKNELLTMLRNSHSKFKEKFDFKKLGTVLQDRSLRPLDETNINLNAILPLLI